MEPVNYYLILGVEIDADLSKIRSAYRKLAVKFHPDKSGTSDTFRKINEAYTVLRDPEKKKKHDEDLRRQLAHVGRTQPHFEGRTRRGSDLHVGVTVRSEDILNQVSKTLSFFRNGLCPYCNGTSVESRTLVKCPKCNGNGIDLVSAMIGPRRFCDTCKGYGDIPEGKPCSKCKGAGLTSEKITRTLILSRNKRCPYTATIASAGHYMTRGGIPGDLIIEVNEEANSLFKIDGKNVRGKISLSPAQAVLGDIIFLEVFGEIVKIPIPKGTAHGAMIEIPEAGIGVNKKGFLILETEIKIPTSISKEEKELYTGLLKIQKGIP